MPNDLTPFNCAAGAHAFELDASTCRCGIVAKPLERGEVLDMVRTWAAAGYVDLFPLLLDAYSRGHQDAFGTVERLIDEYKAGRL